jgi:hypothetical protein
LFVCLVVGFGLRRSRRVALSASARAAQAKAAGNVDPNDI